MGNQHVTSVVSERHTACLCNVSPKVFRSGRGMQPVCILRKSHSKESVRTWSMIGPSTVFPA